jgi:hypothetical protein
MRLQVIRIYKHKSATGVTCPAVCIRSGIRHAANLLMSEIKILASALKAGRSDLLQAVLDVFNFWLQFPDPLLIDSAPQSILPAIRAAFIALQTAIKAVLFRRID